jgi:hypothetical protein
MTMPAEQRWYLARWFLARLFIAFEQDRPRLGRLAMLIAEAMDEDQATDLANAIIAWLAAREVENATGILALAICLWHSTLRFDREIKIPEAGPMMREAVAEFVTEFLRTYAQSDQS